MNKISRRSFFKKGALSIGTMVSAFTLSPDSLWAGSKKEFKTYRTKETTTICCFCAVGCGLIVSTRHGEIVNTEGDPDHPINEGSLCSKGAGLIQTSVNKRRLDNVLYRAPGSTRWEKKSWQWAMSKIAKNIKDTRERTFVQEKDGKPVNRTDGIAQLGGAALDNEECYLIVKLARALGLTWIDHQARI